VGLLGGGYVLWAFIAQLWTKNRITQTEKFEKTRTRESKTVGRLKRLNNNIEFYSYTNVDLKTFEMNLVLVLAVLSQSILGHRQVITFYLILEVFSIYLHNILLRKDLFYSGKGWRLIFTRKLFQILTLSHSLAIWRSISVQNWPIDVNGRIQSVLTS
jgi:hypothetical protein